VSKKAFEQIAAGLADAIAIARGEADPATYRVHAPADIDVLKIRRCLGLTREAFAARFGLQLGTVRDWEQRKRRPEGAARVLLTVIEREPDAVTRALADAARPVDVVEDDAGGLDMARRAASDTAPPMHALAREMPRKAAAARGSKQGKRRA
jgi:putative transcriptional regulator